MGYKIIITAGGTSEKIDDVRKITNTASGKLGFTIANKLIEVKNDFIDKDTQERMRAIVNAKLMSRKRHRKYDED